MARTPVSNGSRTGSRSMALICRRPMGSDTTSCTGPPWSRGRPCASTTRPNKPSPMGKRSTPARCTGRGGSPKRGMGIYGAAGTTLAPLDSPWISPAGIKNARSAENPTTSANTGACPGICTMHCDPTGTRIPTASSTSPVSRVSVPRVSNGAPSATRSRASSMKRVQAESRSTVIAIPKRLVVPG